MRQRRAWDTRVLGLGAARRAGPVKGKWSGETTVLPWRCRAENPRDSEGAMGGAGDLWIETWVVYVW